MSGGDELTGVNLGPVDPATKIVCAQPPFLSLSGLVSNFHRTGIIVRGYVWGTFVSEIWSFEVEICVRADFTM